VRYAGVVLTMPDVLWPIFKRNRHFLRDLPTIGAEAISLWMKEKYGVRPLLLVVQHTFGHHLDFKPHLHILMSAGGLSESNNCWIGRVTLNHVGFMKLWRYAVITYLRRALRAGILESDLKTWELKTIFATQYERYWHSYLDHISKDHFLGYVARYIRRVPIAQRRIESIDGPDVKFWTKDTKTGKTVLDTLSKEEFVKSLADHTPDKYQNAIRYYGGLAPRSKVRTFALTFALLGKKRRPRPERLSWAQLIMRYFGRNPLIDGRGKPMAFVGRYCPGQA
jgi:hypothetical protein